VTYFIAEPMILQLEAADSEELQIESANRLNLMYVKQLINAKRVPQPDNT